MVGERGEGGGVVCDVVYVFIALMSRFRNDEDYEFA